MPEECDATFEAGVLRVIFDCTQIYDTINNKILGRVKKSDLKKLKKEETKKKKVEEVEEEVDQEEASGEQEEHEEQEEQEVEKEAPKKKMSIQRKRGKKPADVCIEWGVAKDNVNVKQQKAQT